MGLIKTFSILFIAFVIIATVFKLSLRSSEENQQTEE